MFDKEYAFYGKHAEIVNRLKGNLNSEIGRGLFKTNYNIYSVAPLIGVLYNRKADLDRSEISTKIFTEKMLKESSELQFNYRLLMLFLQKDKTSLDERVELAFKLDDKDDERAMCDAVFESYVRGGIEVLGEKIFSEGNSVDDYLMNFYNFLEEFNTRYYEKIEQVIDEI